MARPTKQPMMLIIIPILLNLAYFVIGTSMISYTDKISSDQHCRNIDEESRSLITFYGWFVSILSGLSLLLTAGNLLL